MVAPTASKVHNLSNLNDHPESLAVAVSALRVYTSESLQTVFNAESAKVKMEARETSCAKHHHTVYTTTEKLCAVLQRSTATLLKEDN